MRPPDEEREPPRKYASPRWIQAVAGMFDDEEEQSMQLKNTTTQYGIITKTFHWTMALIIISLLCVGFYMGGMPLSETKLEVYGLHKSFGITVLALVICRFCWHLISKKPGLLETLKPWERAGATVVHYALYALMVLMPLSGWVMSSAAGRAVNVFGLFTLPNLVAEDKILADMMRERHEQIAWIIIAAVVLHVGAALKHYFIDKDRTLQRMLPVLLAVVMLLPSAAQANDFKWTYVREESKLSFSGKQTGQDFTGTFERFVPLITFNPDDLSTAQVTVEVDLGSANSNSFERDDNLKGKAWFDVVQFPTARFASTSFRKIGSNRYEVSANLTIRDITLPVTFPFTLDITEKQDDPNVNIAVMDGSITLDRSKFHLGGGSWADPSVIANDVLVNVHLVARNYKVSQP